MTEWLYAGHGNLCQHTLECKDSCNEQHLRRDEVSMPLQGCIDRGEQLHHVVYIARWNKTVSK
jgi:hypothetical protein